MFDETSASAMRCADSKDAALLNAVMLCVVVVMSVVIVVSVGVALGKNHAHLGRSMVKGWPE